MIRLIVCLFLIISLKGDRSYPYVTLDLLIRGGAKVQKWNSEQPTPFVFQKREKHKETRTYSSPAIHTKAKILEQGRKLITSLPKDLYRQIFENKPLTKEVEPYFDEITLIYQRSVRWKTRIEVYFDWYVERRHQDPSGYLYIKNTKDPYADKDKARRAALSLCLHGEYEIGTCIEKIDKLGVKAVVEEYYKAGYWTYEKYFELRGRLKHVKWEKNTFTVYFADPKDDRVRKILKEEIEDEFRWKDWKLILEFVEPKEGLPSIEFQEGVTPHARGFKTIVMDSNASIDSPTERWTLRHEFGHILLFPDCYVEYFNLEEKSVYYYALDPTALMCAINGKFNEDMYKRLKKEYERTEPTTR